MKIIEKLLTPNEYSRPGTKLRPVKAIVLHWLASPHGTGEGVYNWFEGRKDGENGYGSAHFCVEMYGDIYQYLPQDEMAYHVGSETYTAYGLSLSSYPNNCTIGIEMSHLDWEGQMTETTWKTSVALTGALLQQYGLGIDAITTHNAVVGWKDCPRWFFNHPDDLLRFKKDVARYLRYGNIVMATGDVNVRTEPGGTWMKVLKAGEMVQQVGILDGWNKIKFPGQSEDEYGYVYGDYLA